MYTEEKELIDQYMACTEISRQVYGRACAVLPNGNTRRALLYNPYPVYIVRGDGCKIYDADGREYIDYTSNLGPLILGHQPPKVSRAIRKQFENGSVLGGPTELEVRFAEEIIKAFPSGEQILYCASGTEANMLALRAVRAYTGKDVIIKCEGSFHGTADCFLEGPGIPNDISKKMVMVPFNDIESFERALKRNKDKVAAVFIEPVMRGIPPKPGYLAQIRELTSQYGILLVFDEVVTGLRISRGGAQEKWEVSADVTVLGKIIGGGLPAGAVVASRALLKQFRSEDHASLSGDRPQLAVSGTWNAHPLAMAAGLAVLEELDDGAYRHLDEMGSDLSEGILKAAAKAGIIIKVVGIGSIFHVYFTDKDVVDASGIKAAEPLLQRYYDLSLIMKGIYPAKAHCSFISTPVTRREVEKTVCAVQETFYSMKALIKKVAPRLIA